MELNTIPLVKAAFLKPIIEAMLKNGVSPDSYLEQVGLPNHKLTDMESLIPVKPIYTLISLVAMKEGIFDFGAQIAQIRPWHQIESVVPLISHCKNLKELLETVCDVAPSQRTGASYLIENKEGKLWFRYAGPSLVIVKNTPQLELYQISSMILLIQLAAGSAWQPEQVQFLMPSNKRIKNHQLINSSQVAFSQEKSRISFSPELLKLPINLEGPNTIQKNHDYDINDDFIGSFRQIVAIYINNKDLSIEYISKAIGIPVRTLQRRLQQYGLNFTDVVNEAKFNLAKNKLENTSLSIVDIALQLGYSFPENFTLAFNRWVGMSPSKYREQHTKNSMPDSEPNKS